MPEIGKEAVTSFNHNGPSDTEEIPEALMLEILSVAQFAKSSDTGARAAQKSSRQSDEPEASQKSFDEEFELQEPKSDEPAVSTTELNEKGKAAPEPETQNVDEIQAVFPDTPAEVTEATTDAPPNIVKDEARGNSQNPPADAEITPRNSQTLLSGSETRQLSSKTVGGASKQENPVGMAVQSALSSDKVSSVAAKSLQPKDVVANPVPLRSDRDALIPAGNATAEIKSADINGRPTKDVGLPDEKTGASAQATANSAGTRFQTMSSQPLTSAEEQVRQVHPTEGKRELPLTDDFLLRPEGKRPATQVKPMISPLQPLNSIPVSKGREKIEIQSLNAVDFDAVASWEPKSASAGGSSSLPLVFSKPDMPMMIGRQMAEALQRLPDRPVEISLNPSELGRVRMSISAAEAGITVSVLTERPETLDLMRRNIDDLAREFQSLGYESISFAFAEGRQEQAASDDRREQRDVTQLNLEQPMEQGAVETQEIVARSGLDLRL